MLYPNVQQPDYQYPNLYHSLQPNLGPNQDKMKGNSSMVLFLHLYMNRIQVSICKLRSLKLRQELVAPCGTQEGCLMVFPIGNVGDLSP